jgi:adenylate cyclase, class 2
LRLRKKYRLNEREREHILENLLEIGAKFAGEDFEENSIFQGGFSAESGGILRVRKTSGKTLLTFKKSVNTEFDFKQRVEYETEVADFEAMEKIIENLGIEKMLVYEKRRKTWHFRNVEIVLDELPFGLFMEIEGSITAIAEAEMFLDAENFEVEHETYPSLTAKLGKRNGGVVEARFE